MAPGSFTALLLLCLSQLTDSYKPLARKSRSMDSVTDEDLGLMLSLVFSSQNKNNPQRNQRSVSKIGKVIFDETEKDSGEDTMGKMLAASFADQDRGDFLDAFDSSVAPVKRINREKQENLFDSNEIQTGKFQKVKDNTHWYYGTDNNGSKPISNESRNHGGTTEYEHYSRTELAPQTEFLGGRIVETDKIKTEVTEVTSSDAVNETGDHIGSAEMRKSSNNERTPLPDFFTSGGLKFDEVKTEVTETIVEGKKTFDYEITTNETILLSELYPNCELVNHNLKAEVVNVGSSNSGNENWSLSSPSESKKAFGNEKTPPLELLASGEYVVHNVATEVVEEVNKNLDQIDPAVKEDFVTEKPQVPELLPLGEVVSDHEDSVLGGAILSDDGKMQQFSKPIMKPIVDLQETTNSFDVSSILDIERVVKLGDDSQRNPSNKNELNEMKNPSHFVKSNQTLYLTGRETETSTQFVDAIKRIAEYQSADTVLTEQSLFGNVTEIYKGVTGSLGSSENDYNENTIVSSAPFDSDVLYKYQEPRNTTGHVTDGHKHNETSVVHLSSVAHQGDVNSADDMHRLQIHERVTSRKSHPFATTQSYSATGSEITKTRVPHEQNTSRARLNHVTDAALDEAGEHALTYTEGGFAVPSEIADVLTTKSATDSGIVSHGDDSSGRRPVHNVPVLGKERPMSIRSRLVKAGAHEMTKRVPKLGGRTAPSRVVLLPTGVGLNMVKEQHPQQKQAATSRASALRRDCALFIALLFLLMHFLLFSYHL